MSKPNGKEKKPDIVEKAQAPKFHFTDVNEKPRRKYRKGSKYDSLIDSFLKGSAKTVRVEVPGKDANYITTQLKKRIVSRALKSLEASVVNNNTYLEKVDEKPVPPTLPLK